ncbi:MAG: CarD family transcriptional regulator [Pseudolabrys sp.]
MADKSRQKSKKTTSGSSRSAKKPAAATRRSSPAARGPARAAAPAKVPGPKAHAAKVSVPKAPVAKVAGQGAVPGMPTTTTTATTKKTAQQRHGFKTSEFIVYPAHGVGQIMAIEEQEIAGAKLELFVISFIKDKMTLRVPTAKIVAVGMRKLSEPALVKKALETLKGRARIKRTMWSRRAQEYEAKINSGDIVAIAEVVRDLYRSENQPEQSYSERQLYEAALDRLSREVAAVQKVTETEAIKEIEAALAKGPRRGPKPAEAAAEGEGDEGGSDEESADEAA